MNDLSPVDNAYKIGAPVGIVARPEYLDREIPEFYKKTFPHCPKECHTLAQIFDYAQQLPPEEGKRKQDIIDFAVRITKRMAFGNLDDLKIYMGTRNPPIDLSIQPDPLPSIFDTNIKIVNLVKYHEHNENCPPIPRRQALRHRHCVIL